MFWNISYLWEQHWEAGRSSDTHLFMEPRGSVPSSQEPATTGLYLSHMNPIYIKRLSAVFLLTLSGTRRAPGSI